MRERVFARLGIRTIGDILDKPIQDSKIRGAIQQCQQKPDKRLFEGIRGLIRLVRTGAQHQSQSQALDKTVASSFATVATPSIPSNVQSALEQLLHEGTDTVLQHRSLFMCHWCKRPRAAIITRIGHICFDCLKAECDKEGESIVRDSWTYCWQLGSLAADLAALHVNASGPIQVRHLE